MPVYWQAFYFITLRFFAKLPLLLFSRFSVYCVMALFITQQFTCFCSENVNFLKNQSKRSFILSKKLLSSLLGFGLKDSLFLRDSMISFSSLDSLFGIHTAIFT